MDIFILCVSGIIDHDPGIPYERYEIRIGSVAGMLVVGNVAKRPIIIFYTISDGASGVDQADCPDHDTVTKVQDIARGKIAIVNIRLEAFRPNGEKGRIHELVDHLLAGHAVLEMAGPDPHFIAFSVQGIEERKAVDMVVMTMGKQDIDAANPFFGERHAGGMGAGSGVKHQHPVAAPDFDTAGIAPDIHMGPPRRRNTAPDAPEFYAEYALGHRQAMASGTLCQCRLR